MHHFEHRPTNNIICRIRIPVICPVFISTSFRLVYCDNIYCTYYTCLSDISIKILTLSSVLGMCANYDRHVCACHIIHRGSEKNVHFLLELRQIYLQKFTEICGNLFVNILAYADDMALLSPSWHAMQELLKILES